MPGISKINIEQQLAEIGIKTTPAKMNIELPKLTMKIKSVDPEFKIDRKDPSFKINRKKINSESGIKTAGEFTKAYRDKGKSTAFQAMGEIKNKGNMLGNVRRRGNRVAMFSRQKTLQPALNKKLNIGLMPKSRPEVDWDPGYVKIHWSKYSISIDWDGEYLPQVTIDPKHSVEVYLREKPYFRIMVEEASDPYAPGRHVDKFL